MGAGTGVSPACKLKTKPEFAGGRTPPQTAVPGIAGRLACRPRPASPATFCGSLSPWARDGQRPLPPRPFAGHFSVKPKPGHSERGRHHRASPRRPS